MNAIGLLRKSFLLSRQSVSSFLSGSFLFRNHHVVSQSCNAVRKETNVAIKNNIRKYCDHQNSPKYEPKEARKRTGLKGLKYVSGFIGACILAAVSVRVYKRMKYKMKGIEPVKSRHYKRGNIPYRYRGYILPGFVVDKIDTIEAFEVREDDIWIVGFPKTGTTWLGETIYVINNEADFESAKVKIDDRFPYFEYFYPGLDVIEKTLSPRYMKTHLPFSILPKDYEKKKPKTFYITRNPKDTVVSFHFFLTEFFVNTMWRLTFSFDEYCQVFLDDLVFYGPWWKHVLEGWDRRNDDNVLFLTYEDMKLDFPDNIRKIAKFLGKNLSDKDVEAIASHCSFEEMRKNNYVNYSWFKDAGIAQEHGHFMRKGKIGDWKNHMSKEVEAKLDDIVATKLEPVGIKYRTVSKDDKKR